MPTKQQIRKYIHKIKSCDRIEVFKEPNSDNRWIHFISRNGEFLGFTFAIPYNPLDRFVEREVMYMISKGKIRDDLGDPSIYCVKRNHLRWYQRDGVIVRKDGKWTWVK